MVFSSVTSQTWFILLMVVLIAIVIMGACFLLYKFINRNNKVEKPSDEQIAKENVSRLVVDIEEEPVKKDEEENKD